jgi:hypothetical protein
MLGLHHHRSPTNSQISKKDAERHPKNDRKGRELGRVDQIGRIRQPLGYTIVGGLILSQFLTLFTTPVVYIYLDRLQESLRRWRGSNQPAKAVA